MDFNDLITLCKAGYSKDEISALAKNFSPPVKKADTELIKEAPEAPKVEEPAATNTTTLEDLKKEVESLRQQLFNKNITTIQQPSASDVLTADDITGILLNSEEMKKGGK